MPALPPRNEAPSRERRWTDEPRTSGGVRAVRPPGFAEANGLEERRQRLKGPPRPSNQVDERSGKQGSSPLHQASVAVDDLLPGRCDPPIPHGWMTSVRTCLLQHRPVGRVLGPALEQPGNGAAGLRRGARAQLLSMVPSGGGRKEGKFGPCLETG